MIERNVVLIILLLGLAIAVMLILSGMGCISASSSTGADASAKVSGKQQSSQETTATDEVVLEIPSSVITLTDPAGKVFVVANIGGGKARTGSKTEQATDMNQKLDAYAKSQAEATAKAGVNMTYLLLGIVALILISGGSRFVGVVKKLYKPI